jgi:hypothetical protein
MLTGDSADHLKSLASISLCLGLGGCVKQLPLDQLESADPAQPHAVILYSGVRDGARRFGDYTAIDQKILAR